MRVITVAVVLGGWLASASLAMAQTAQPSKFSRISTRSSFRAVDSDKKEKKGVGDRGRDQGPRSRPEADRN